MTPTRRLLILGTIATSLVACDARATAPAATDPAAVASLPTPTVPSSSVAPLASPTATAAAVNPDGCTARLEDIDPPSPFVDATASIGRLVVDLQVTRIAERYGEQRAVVPPVRALQNDVVGLLVGGHEFTASPSTAYEGYGPPITIEMATLTLNLTGHAPVALPARFVPGNENYNQVAVAVADVAGTGTLDVHLAWTDQCFRFEASASTRVQVVKTATTNGCAVENEHAYQAQLHALVDGSLRVGEIVPTSTSPYNQARFTPVSNAGIDAWIGSLFDPNVSAIEATPGARILIENLHDGLRLENDMTVTVWTRASLTKAMAGDGVPNPTVYLHWLPGKQADGSFRFPVPKAPGRYVAAISVGYETSCTTGTLWTVVNLDVAP